MIIKEITCKSAASKGGFSENSVCINPYTGCQHACLYCYARFMRRFQNIKEPWGTFVYVKKNIAEVLEKQMKNKSMQKKVFFIGTVTDAYQQLEERYQLTRKILQVLLKYQPEIEILTKSDLVLRDLDLLKQFKRIAIGFTVNSLDEKWASIVEPNSPSPRVRLQTAKTLSTAGINIYFMMGPYWPIFTDTEALFKEFKAAGASHLFTESFNAIGGNWTGVEKAMQKHYPELLPKMKEIIFNKFNEFYSSEEKKIRALSKKYNLPITIFFAKGHAKNKVS